LRSCEKFLIALSLCTWQERAGERRQFLSLMLNFSQLQRARATSVDDFAIAVEMCLKSNLNVRTNENHVRSN
jgi:hypothetical protein